MQSVSIRTEFFYSLLREIATKPDDIYLYNDDLDKLFPKGADNTFVIGQGENLIMMCLKEDVLSIQYSNNNPLFTRLIEKYTQSVSPELAVYLKASCVDNIKTSNDNPLKPKKTLNSQPSFFRKPFSPDEHRGSPPDQKQFRKLSLEPEGKLCGHRELGARQISDPLLQAVEADPILHSEDKYSLKNIMKIYTHYGDQPMLDSILILHALIDPLAYQYFRGVKNKKLSDTEKGLLKQSKPLLVQLHKKRKKSRENTSRTPSPLQRRGPDSEKKDVAMEEVEIALRNIACQYIVFASQNNSNFIINLCRSFTNHQQELYKLINCLLDSLMHANNDNMMIKLFEICFSDAGYSLSGNSPEFSKWHMLLTRYIERHKSLPDCFATGPALFRFLSFLTIKTSVNLINTIVEAELFDAFYNIIFNRLINHDLHLARALMREANKPVATLLRQKGDKLWYLTMLSVNHKTVDLWLLSEPKFLAIIQNSDCPVTICLYSALLERMKIAFEYHNLPEDGENGSDVRQTQMGGNLLMQSRSRLNQALENLFLSSQEISEIFIHRVVPTNKLSEGEKWLAYYKSNLALILARFTPHLPKHLAEIPEIYGAYYDQTIGKTATIDSDRYDPNLHVLTEFPPIMRKYLLSSDIEEFNNNLALMGLHFNTIRNLTNGTIRMGNKRQSGFTPATRIADKIFKTLPKNATQFTTFTLGKLLSVLIVEHCQKLLDTTGQLNKICSETTINCIMDNVRQVLWLKIELADDLVIQMNSAINKLKNPIDNSIDADAFNENIVIDVITDFCQQHFRTAQRKLSFEHSSSSMMLQ